MDARSVSSLPPLSRTQLLAAACCNSDRSHCRSDCCHCNTEPVFFRGRWASSHSSRSDWRLHPTPSMFMPHEQPTDTDGTCQADQHCDARLEHCSCLKIFNVLTLCHGHDAFNFFRALTDQLLVLPSAIGATTDREKTQQVMTSVLIRDPCFVNDWTSQTTML